MVDLNRVEWGQYRCTEQTMKSAVRAEALGANIRQQAVIDALVLVAIPLLTLLPA
jgi:hypothetical protein